MPPNIIFATPRKNVQGHANGSVHVVIEAASLENDYMTINSFGLGAANVRLLLKRNPREKLSNVIPNEDLPKLVILSERNEESVKLFLSVHSGSKIFSKLSYM